ncbi:hypothetical protein [Mucilaginibacter paludis]|uniref:Lipoprotein n=1 Tax=Mucilaginibacter paludis DSM 18603 TaxID=714943 RepID=H1Y859_9SPHI|nr:hypothetical protein [Mucilaginibacter paludis]EHQ31081.1 hypothetical protein Mucpa_7037 [Mucilaginibacter paludis DSM 18603]
MKKLIKLFFCFTGLALSACQNDPDYKAVRQQVLDQHDKIMMDGEKAMTFKMKLDTLAMSALAKFKQQQPSLDTTAELQQLKTLSKKLNDADERMNDWMHNFKTDVDGKTNAEAVSYFNGEQVKIRQLDSIYKMVLKESADYLKRFNVKTDTSMKTMDHMKM